MIMGGPPAVIAYGEVKACDGGGKSMLDYHGQSWKSDMVRANAKLSWKSVKQGKVRSNTV